MTLLPLPLLVLGVGADHPHHALAVDDLAVITHLLDRSPYFHCRSPLRRELVRRLFSSLVAVCDPPSVQVVWRKLDEHSVAGEDADEVLPHLA